MRPGFKRLELTQRYDVSAIWEDEWHSYSGLQTSKLIRKSLSAFEIVPRRLLNAGAGCYELRLPNWEEISVDLFISPLGSRDLAVCANIEWLPFAANTFGSVICVGEVLAYCDPAKAIAEFARILAPSGRLICDFGNSRSVQYRYTQSYGRAADLVIDHYNGSAEKVWVYSSSYIRDLLSLHNFQIEEELGTHTWSAIARRMGFSISQAMNFEKRLRWVPLPKDWASLMTVVAAQKKTSK